MGAGQDDSAGEVRRPQIDEAGVELIVGPVSEAEESPIPGETRVADQRVFGKARGDRLLFSSRVGNSNYLTNLIPLVVTQEIDKSPVGRDYSLGST